VSLDEKSEDAEKWMKGFPDGHGKEAGAHRVGWAGAEGAKALKVPSTGRLLLSADGKVLAYFSGYTPESPRVLKRFVDAALAGAL
jgi:hypothetical protein